MFEFFKGLKKHARAIFFTNRVIALKDSEPRLPLS